MTDWGYSKMYWNKKEIKIKDNTNKFEIDKFITLKTVKRGRDCIWLEWKYWYMVLKNRYKIDQVSK